MVTIREVAARAGVSVATVSNALNDRKNVSSRTREQIKELAAEMGYAPNRAAQAMVHKYTRNICIIVSGPASFKVFTNPIFLDVIRTVTATLTKYHYEVLLRVISTEDERAQVAAIERSHIADGIIYVGTRHTDEDLNEIFHELSIPIVVLIRHSPSPEIYSVSVDNFECGFIGTKHLIDAGHRDIAFVGVLERSSMADLRLEGYRVALKDAGIPHREEFEIEGDYYQDAGVAAAPRVAELRRRAPITAVYAANDLMAIGLIEGLKAEGYSVPGDISVVGTDGIRNLDLLRVPLTSVESDFGRIGEQGAELLLQVLAKNVPETTHEVLAPRLVERGSTREIPVHATSPFPVTATN